MVHSRERIWRKYKENHQWQAYNIETNENVDLQSAPFCDKIHANKGKTKELYKIVSDLTGAHKENPLPEANSDRELEEDVADFIIRKMQKVRDSLDQYKQFEPTARQVISTRVLHPIVKICS